MGNKPMQGRAQITAELPEGMYFVVADGNGKIEVTDELPVEVLDGIEFHLNSDHKVCSWRNHRLGTCRDVDGLIYAPNPMSPTLLGVCKTHESASAGLWRMYGAKAGKLSMATAQ